MAAEDSFDRGTVALAGLFAGEAQLSNSNRSFGQGVWDTGAIWVRRTVISLSETICQKRFFRRFFIRTHAISGGARGTGWSRIGYAMSQIFVTHSDSGRMQFNYSEVVGNSAAVAISDAYYSNNRTASDGVSKLGMQLGVDMAANILKEFYPDLQRKFRRKPRGMTVQGGNSRLKATYGCVASLRGII